MGIFNALLGTQSSTTTSPSSNPQFNLTNLYISIVIIVITFLLLTFIKKYLIKKVAYTNKDEQHKNTFIGVFFNLLQYLVVIVAIILVLKVNGYNITSIIAGLGIMATIVGLALQDSLKDIISGVNIYNNNFYKVGDVVNYGGQPCEVKYFSARVTKFRSLYTDSTYTVCNSTINSIEKIKKQNIIMMMFDFEDDKELIADAFKSTCEIAEPLYGISNCSYWGIVEINEVGVKYAIGFKANPKMIEAKCKVYDILYDELKKRGISPSFNDEVKIQRV